MFSHTRIILFIVIMVDALKVNNSHGEDCHGEGSFHTSDTFTQFQDSGNPGLKLLVSACVKGMVKIRTQSFSRLRLGCRSIKKD